MDNNTLQALFCTFLSAAFAAAVASFCFSVKAAMKKIVRGK